MRTITRYLTLLFLLLTVLSLAGSALANSAEPPSLIIITSRAPEGTVVTAFTSQGKIDGTSRSAAWERYSVFYFHGQDMGQNITLHVSGPEKEFDVLLDASSLRSYNHVLTINYVTETISAGKLLTRSILLIGLRVLLTLICEGLLFYLFGYRQKQSWIIFLLINLITQTGLNIWINTASPVASYLLLGLIFIEILVMIAEIIAFLICIREHRKLRTVCYVLAANLTSLILGGCLITMLPV